MVGIEQQLIVKGTSLTMPLTFLGQDFSYYKD